MTKTNHANAFVDGLKNVFNQLANRRNGTSQNQVESFRLSDEQARAIFRTGLGRKIVSLKSGYALNDTLQFENDQDKLFYKKRLAKSVKRASKFMIAFGRGIIVMHERGADLKMPMGGNVDPKNIKLSVFSGDMVFTNNTSTDLSSPRYQKPMYYQVRGNEIHHSRVIDFTYYEPAELDLPDYRYGGVSEFEMVYTQLINDGIVERASSTIIDKSSTLFYKIKGFKDAMKQKRDGDMVEYFSRVADSRGIFGDGLLDQEDEIEVHGQNLSNLSEVDNITLRRLAMVTGIPLNILIGESANGLNATGDNERQSLQDTIEIIQSDYLEDPINSLCTVFGLGEVEFKDNQGETAAGRAEYDKLILGNAMILNQLGEDHSKYLASKDIVAETPVEDFFGEISSTEDDFPEGAETLGEAMELAKIEV